MIRAAAATLAAAALTLAAGCSSSGPAAPPQGGTPAGNALVCQHYLAQRQWVKHLAYPTVADAVKFEGYVTVDAAQATGKLHSDLAALEAAQHDPDGPVYAASVRVYQDCT